MQDLNIWKPYSATGPDDSSSVGDSTAEIAFLVNGRDVSSVSASRYIAVLPFAYFPSLHAVALEFPLDVSLERAAFLGTLSKRSLPRTIYITLINLNLQTKKFASSFTTNSRKKQGRRRRFTDWTEF